MKNVETYQYFSSSGYIIGHKNPLCRVPITLAKEAKNVIMQRTITKKLCKTVKTCIEVRLLVHSKKCKRGSRRKNYFKDTLCNLLHRKDDYNPFTLIFEN